MRVRSKTIIWIGFLLFSEPSQAVTAARSALKLQGEYLAMAEVRQAAGTSQLALFSADQSEPRRRRHVEFYDKTKSTLTQSPTMDVPVDAAAYDVCKLSPDAKTETVLFLRKDGVYALGGTTPLASEATLFPTGRDDSLPRVRICFDLFKNEGSALVVPRLSGVTIFRQAKPGVFSPHERIDSDAELGFQGTVLRGDELRNTQRLSVRFEFPAVTAPDFNGDGRKDLCFNFEERLVCHLQGDATGFTKARVIAKQLSILTPEEKLDTSLRVSSRLVDVSGDGRPDLIVSKATWSVSDMGATLKIFVQQGDGSFPKTPTQEISRTGYFSYQEYFDYDGDGFIDLVAPVATLGWSELARIYLSRKADIEFVWYKNNGGRFDTKERFIHSMSFPVEFKNIAAILGSLPLWDVRFTSTAPARGRRQVLFFPKKSGVELRVATAMGLTDKTLWSEGAPLGSDTIAVDLDGDGRHEIVSAYPKDQERSRSLLFIDTPEIAVGQQEGD